MKSTEYRVAYFGTWGCKGHFFRPIKGSFTKRERDAMSNIDLPVFHEQMESEGYCYVVWEKFLGYAIPFSRDDKRPGCVSAIFVEGAETSKDILEVLQNADIVLQSRFSKRLPKPNET